MFIGTSVAAWRGSRFPRTSFERHAPFFSLSILETDVWAGPTGMRRLALVTCPEAWFPTAMPREQAFAPEREEQWTRLLTPTSSSLEKEMQLAELFHETAALPTLADAGLAPPPAVNTDEKLTSNSLAELDDIPLDSPAASLHQHRFGTNFPDPSLVLRI